MVPCGELAVIWELATAINAGSWRGIMVLELGQQHGIQVRMTGSEADDAVWFAAGRLTCLSRRCCS
jgi:hypothetical protein